MHGKARERVWVEGLMVNLVDILVQHLSVEESVCPVKVKIGPHVHENDSREKYSHWHWAVVVHEEIW